MRALFQLSDYQTAGFAQTNSQHERLRENFTQSRVSFTHLFIPKFCLSSFCSKIRETTAWHRKCHWCFMRLNLHNQIAQSDTKCFGNPNKRANAYRFASAFDFAEINGVQISSFRQIFLTHSGIFAVFADCFADFFLMGEMGCQASSSNHQSARMNTRLNLLFILQSFCQETKM
jgi:hypothetical protein